MQFGAALCDLLFMVDVQIGTVGYLLTARPLDAHIRSGNPLLAGWVAALMCYPPFILMGGGAVIDYHQGTRDWSVSAGVHLALRTLPKGTRTMYFSGDSSDRPCNSIPGGMAGH